MIDQTKRYVRPKEAAIEPALPFIDPHHHFYQQAGGFPPFLWPRYVLGDLLGDLNSGHNVVATVFVQCGAGERSSGPPHLKCVGETDYVQSLAEQAAAMPDNKINVAAGIVSSADLSLGNALDEVLEAHIAAAPDRFRGIRLNAFWHKNPIIHSPLIVPKPLLHEAKIREGAARLAHFGLTFETWTYHTQLQELTDFAKSLPDLTIILNHMGGPIGIGEYAAKPDEVFADWSKGMKALAQCPNVYVKLGGINMETNGFDWDAGGPYPTSEEIARVTQHFYLRAIEYFGPSRCMFESNFPMEAVAYPTLLNVFKRITSGFSSCERADLFHNTAARVYRLPVELV